MESAQSPVSPPPYHVAQTAALPARRGGAVALVALGLAAVGCGFSIAAFLIVMLHSPLPGKGLNAYAWGTPEDTLKSETAMGANFDLRAQMEQAKNRVQPRATEKLGSLKIEKRREYDGKVLLFVSYKEKGKEKREITAFEKDAETGQWERAFLSKYGMPESNAIRKEMEEWEKN